MEKQMVFSSITAEVRFYIMQYVAQEEREYERKELVDLVYQKMGDNESVTAGVIAGAIKMLVGSGELVVVKRGVFRKGVRRCKSTSFEKIYNVCSRFTMDFEKACTVNMLSLTEEERILYPEIVEVLELGRANIYGFMEQLDGLLNQIKASEMDKSLIAGSAASDVAECTGVADGAVCEPETVQPEVKIDAVVDEIAVSEPEHVEDGLNGSTDETGTVGTKKSRKHKEPKSEA